MGGGGSPEVCEGALKGEAVHVVEGDAAGFHGFAMVYGREPDGAIDDDYAQRVVEQRGQGLVVDVKNTSLQAQFLGKVGNEFGIVVVAAVEGMVLEDEGGLGGCMSGEGAEDV